MVWSVVLHHKTPAQSGRIAGIPFKVRVHPPDEVGLVRTNGWTGSEKGFEHTPDKKPPRLAWEFPAPGAQSTRSGGDEIYKGAPPGGAQVLAADAENPGRLASLARRGDKLSVISCNRYAGVKSAMRKMKQETREEKLNREIGNLTRFLDQAPSLKCIQESRTELLDHLALLSPAQRSALVPWTETRRDAKFCIKVLGELIAEKQKKLRAKQRETRKSVSELRQCQVKFERQLACLKWMGV